MTNIDTISNSYLSFRLGKEMFAAHVSKTLKILQLSEITKVPHAPPNMKGVINHHGNVLPVVDMNQTLALEETEYTNNTCIIILSVEINNNQINVGAIVDEVLNVENINDDQITDPPSMGSKHSLGYISGVFKKDDEFIMILNINNIFKEINLEQ